MKIFRYILFIFIYILLLGISGLLNVVVFKELDWSVLLDADFWVELIVDYALYLLVFINTAMLTYEIFADKDMEYIGLENDIFSMKDVLVGKEFSNDVVNHNFSKKEKAWDEELQTAIGNHERKKTQKMVEELIRPRETWTKKTIKWVKQREKLDKMSSKTYVDKYLMYKKRYNYNFWTMFKKVKYEEITVNEIIYGTVTVRSKSSLLVRKPLGRRILLRMTTILPSLLFSVLYRLLIIDRFISTVELLKSLAFMIFMAFFHALFGLFTSKKAHLDRKSNATTRYGYALDYKKGHRYPKAPMFKINEIEKEREIE